MAAVHGVAAARHATTRAMAIRPCARAIRSEGMDTGAFRARKHRRKRCPENNRAINWVNRAGLRRIVKKGSEFAAKLRQRLSISSAKRTAISYRHQQLALWRHADANC